MEKTRIVLDTNVLLAGLYSSAGASHKVLDAVEREKVAIVLSIALVFEYEEVLKRHKRSLGLSNEDVDVVLDNLCLLGEHQTIYFLWRPQLRDPKDDHLLELAVASGVDTIVTHNVRDFRGVEKFGIRAITPGKFLEEI
ncbi:MAG: putative toxin-antitoxin system toxin component, PIN family [Planctomycetota bacterium]